jgi:hypothetical protein
VLPLTQWEQFVDLNYLYHRRGVSLIMAGRANCDRSRTAHRSLAAAYAQRIAQTVGRNRALAG